MSNKNGRTYNTSNLFDLLPKMYYVFPVGGGLPLAIFETKADAKRYVDALNDAIVQVKYSVNEVPYYAKDGNK